MERFRSSHHFRGLQARSERIGSNLYVKEARLGQTDALSMVSISEPLNGSLDIVLRMNPGQVPVRHRCDTEACCRRSGGPDSRAAAIARISTRPRIRTRKGDSRFAGSRLAITGSLRGKTSSRSLISILQC